MEEIIKQNGVWKSINPELDAKKCHINMAKRLPMLSVSDKYESCCSEWVTVGGHKEGDVDSNGRKIKNYICLCGQLIADQYYFINNLTKEWCVMGCKCCERINKTCIVKYNASLKKKGNCWLCNTAHTDLDTHFNSKNHKKALESHMKIFKESKILMLLNSKINMINEDYIRSQKLKTHIKCIGLNCAEYISKDEPSWKIRCVKCYVKHINKK